MNKKFFVLLCAVFFSHISWGGVRLAYADVAIDDANFPDDNFRAYIATVSFDQDQDGVLSDTEIKAVLSIHASSKDISSLQGIEYFTALDYLDCSYNQLTSLGMSDNPNLLYLDCQNNQLTNLDVSKCTYLYLLDCSYNNLAELDVSNNTMLSVLGCYVNSLTTLDISSCKSLSVLDCSHNNLTELNVNNNTVLNALYCDNNDITELDFSSNDLVLLQLSGNTLQSLSVADQHLFDLDLSDQSSLTNAKLSPQNISQYTSVAIKATSDDSYPYEYVFLPYGNEAIPSFDRILSLDARDKDGVSVGILLSGDDKVLVSDQPATISYMYDTMAPSLDDPYMSVNISFISLDDILSITITSPDNGLITLPSSGGTFDGIIATIDNPNGIASTDLKWGILLDGGNAYIKYEGDFFTISGDVPENTTSIDKSYILELWCDTDFHGMSVHASASLDIVVKEMPLEVHVISPDNHVITLPSSGGYFGDVIVSVSGGYDWYELYYDESKLSCDITQSGDVFVVSGIALKNSTRSNISYDVDVGFTRHYEPYRDSGGPGAVMTVGDGFTVVIEAVPYKASQKYQTFSFTMPSSLSSKLASKFGVDSSQMHQFDSSEIDYSELDTTWLNSAKSDVGSIGENFLTETAILKPSKTGVYVMQISLTGTGYKAGDTLNVHFVSSSGAIKASATVPGEDSIEYVLYDEDGNEITTAPSSGVAYVAMNVDTAGKELIGLITSESAPAAPVVTEVIATPVEETVQPTIVENVVNVINEIIQSQPETGLKTVTSEDINFISEEQIIKHEEPTQEAKQEITKKAKEEEYEIVTKITTLSVDKTGYYVFEVTLPDDIWEQVQGVEVKDLRVYYAILDSIKKSSNVEASVVMGLLNTWELLTLKGEKMKFSAKNFLMVGLLNAGSPLTLFLAKAIMALLFGGGCNAGFGVIIVGALAWKFLRNKR